MLRPDSSGTESHNANCPESNAGTELNSKAHISPVRLLEEAVGAQVKAQGATATSPTAQTPSSEEAAKGGKERKESVDEQVKKISDVFGKCEEKGIECGMGAGKFKW